MRCRQEKCSRMFIFLGKDAVFFPSKEIMLHDVEAKSYDSIYERINALYRIVNDDYGFIVTSAEALCQNLLTGSS